VKAVRQEAWALLGLRASQGPAGPQGTFDRSECGTQSASGNNVGVPLALVEVRAECPPGTFVFQHSGVSSSVDSNINQIELFTRPGEKAAFAVEYTAGFNKPGGLVFQFTTSALCCPVRGS
jgi:hypothetical protein